MSVQLAADPCGSTREAYDRWAATYPPEPHNPLMRAEQQAMLAWWPEVRGGRALDLGCGSGRYSRLLSASGAASVVAVDFSLPMLARVRRASAVCAGMLELPFAGGSFDCVVSGLAIGHAADLDGWMQEAARVVRSPGVVLYSDFHAAASEAGLPRSFQHAGRHYAVPHHRHSAPLQTEAAARAGLKVEAMRELRAGIEVNEQFAGSEEFYARWHGLPLVLVARLRK